MTEAQLHSLRSLMLKQISLSGYAENEVPITCDQCSIRQNCEQVYDLYNTFGNCKNELE